jgi:hypothetical protein
MRLAFVCYGSSSTIPSPIITKRFFTDAQVVTKEINENFLYLGLGTTNPGSGKGMAALEGIIAGIEVSAHRCQYV